MPFCFVICPWALQENNALELANQNACYISYKHKPYNNVDLYSHFIQEIVNLVFFYSNHVIDPASFFYCSDIVIFIKPIVIFNSNIFVNWVLRSSQETE